MNNIRFVKSKDSNIEIIDTKEIIHETSQGFAKSLRNQKPDCLNYLQSSIKLLTSFRTWVTTGHFIAFCMTIFLKERL